MSDEVHSLIIWLFADVPELCCEFSRATGNVDSPILSIYSSDTPREFFQYNEIRNYWRTDDCSVIGASTYLDFAKTYWNDDL